MPPVITPHLARQLARGRIPPRTPLARLKGFAKHLKVQGVNSLFFGNDLFCLLFAPLYWWAKFSLEWEASGGLSFIAGNAELFDEAQRVAQDAPQLCLMRPVPVVTQSESRRRKSAREVEVSCFARASTGL